MTTTIALLRGINVGGKHPVPMGDLRSMLEGMGFSDVRTLLQSGNAVFTASGSVEEADLEEEFGKWFGFSVEIVLRSSDEMDAVIRANPFPNEAKSDPSHLLVIFTKSAVDAAEVEAVRKAVTGPERMKAAGRELYVVYPEGIGTSKVDRTPGWKKLAGGGTARNWNTVLKLAALAGL